MSGAFNPSGTVVAPRHTVPVGGIDVSGNFPAIIVYVEQGAKSYREFRRFCSHMSLGLIVYSDCEENRRAGNIPGTSVCQEGAWEVIGPIDVLERLSTHPSVRHWHPVLSRSVRTQGAGAGPEKIVSRKKAKDPVVAAWTDLHNKYRDALRNGRTDEAAKLLGLLSTGRGKPE